MEARTHIRFQSSSFGVVEKRIQPEITNFHDAHTTAIR